MKDKKKNKDKDSKSDKKDAAITAPGDRQADTGQPQSTGGFDLAYETEKLEAAAQKLIDEEKAAKLAEQSPPEDMAEEIKDGFTELTKENKGGL